MRPWLLLAVLSCTPAYGDVVVPPVIADGTLDACAEQTHRVRVAEGDVIRGSVQQEDVDLIVRVIAPNGVELLRTNRNEDLGQGRESFLAVAPHGGEHHLVVSTAKGVPASYRLEISAIAPATSDDLAIAAGQAFLNDDRPVNDADAIIARYEDALTLCRSGGGNECEADALQALGQVYWRAGRDLNRGREYLRESLRLRERSGDLLGELSLLNDLGVLSKSMGELLDARGYFERLLATDPTPDPIQLHNFAPVQWQLGELQQALDLEQRAIEAWRVSGDRIGMGYGLVVLGKFRLQLGDARAALRLHEEALAIWRSTGWPGGIAESLLQVGQDRAALGEHAEALRNWREALRNFEAEKHAPGQGRTKVKLVSALLRNGDSDAAMGAALSARELFRTSGYDEDDAIRAIADVYAAKGDAGPALEWYGRALEAYRASSDRVSELETHVARARVELRQGALAAARTTLDEALAALEALRYSLVSPDERASYMAARQTIFDLSIDVRMRMHAGDPDAGHDRAALEVSERARARSLLDSLPLARIAGESGVDPALLAREQELRSRVSGKAAAIPAADRSRAERLRDEVQALLAEHRTVTAAIHRADSRFEALMTEPAGVEEIQRQLDQDVLLVEYSLGDERSWVWAVGRTSVFSAALPPRSEIEAAARRARELLPLTRKREMAVPARRALSALADLVIAPLGTRLKGRRLAIVADGALQYVPFGALPGPDGSPLLTGHEIVSLPSASLLAVLRRVSPPAAAMTVAVVADPVLTADDPRVRDGKGPSNAPADLLRSMADFGEQEFQRLPHTREEATAIAALLSPERHVAILDFEANRATTMSGLLSRYRVVHFASHALINDRHPELSGLVLSLVDERGAPQDGFLRLLDIYRLRLEADLVVLSACRTGLGKDVTREGLVGLARGFMHAGSPRVVATLWDVRDAATAELMKRFYRFMIEKRMRPAAALRAAQLSLRGEPRWNAPAYWAGFLLQGEWR